MKQLLFLLLFPCLAMAQYPSNGNQKISLGEQTTADGLVYRGLAADTTRKPSVDTMAYILLDTNTNIIWQYKKAVNNAWTRVGGSISSGVTGVLPVANGGTGQSTLEANKVMVGNGTSGVLTPTNLHWDNTNSRLGIGTASLSNPLSVVSSGGSFLIDNNGQFTTKQNLDVATSGSRWTAQSGRGTLGRIAIEQVTTGADGGEIIFQTIPSGSTTLTERLRILQNGFVGIGTNNPQFRLDVQNPQGTIYIKSTTGTNDAYFRTANDGGDGFFGLESSIGGNVVVNGTPYSLVVSHNSARSFHLGTSNTVRLTVNSAGNVGIGTTAPAVQLHTTGAVRFATFAGGGTTTLDVDNTGNLARTSSIELKKDVTPINYGLNQILQINPINFNWIDEDKYGNENENGFIAEDVMNVIPNVVGSDAHGLFMDYTKLIPILTKAIQEQQALIKSLEQRILILENK